MKNSETIQRMYQAFGEGDIESILEQVADDATWDYGSTTIEVPWLRRREGRQGAKEFFEAVGANLHFDKFEPKAVLDGGDVVVGLVDIEATVVGTGKRIREIDAAHVFRFNQEGKITGFRHGVDTYEHFHAYAASAGASAG